MFSKNYFLVFILTFFVAGFIFLALPETGFSQEGCCRNNGAQCPQCGSVGQDDFCMSPNVDCNTFVAGEFCVRTQGQDQCEPSGCCLVDDTCIGDLPETACEGPGIGGEYLGDGACGQFQECIQVFGCCSTDNGPTCANNILSTNCEGTNPAQTFSPNGECITSGSDEGLCEAGPPIEGCCQLTLDTDTCNSDNSNQCNGVGFVAGGVCDSSGLCDAPQGGCCVFGENDCAFITEMECDDDDGEFTDIDVQCSEVPICNVVPVSAIPTIGEW